jgi:ribonuclease HI
VVFPGRTEPDTLEAMACREALALARDIKASRVLIASDCKNVVTSLEEGSREVYAKIVEEIVAAKEEFEDLSFIHEGRRKNKESHGLARSIVYASQGRQVWFLNPPEGICNMLNSDS